MLIPLSENAVTFVGCYLCQKMLLPLSEYAGTYCFFQNILKCLEKMRNEVANWNQYYNKKEESTQNLNSKLIIQERPCNVLFVINN